MARIVATIINALNFTVNNSNHRIFLQNICIIFVSLSLVNLVNGSKNERVCTGTSMGFSSNRNDYLKWKAIYTDCIYVDGNVEINSFAPYSETDNTLSEYALQTDQNAYNFSFLDNIREITGYLLIHDNKYLKSLRFKNLRLIRGKSLLSDSISLFIENNDLLENLDLTNLREIQRGGVYVQNNPRLCHMNEVNWLDLMPNKINNMISISNNANPKSCPKCSETCCNSTDLNCGCWFSHGCQKLTKVICDSRCHGNRCFGPGPYECCDKQCLGGCTGPSKNDCVACTKLRIKTTGECVETCPRVQIPDPITQKLVYNPDGMYQYGITCVKTCPKKSFIYKEFCLKNCPNDTYEEIGLIYNPETGEKGSRRFCKPCQNDGKVNEQCSKTCSIDRELSIENIKNLEGCVILKSNLMIMNDATISSSMNASNLPRELNETDLQVLSSLRIINGFVRIQSHKLENLNFLKNLEIVRANDLIMDKYSMLIISNSLRRLSLNKLKKVDNGIIYLHTKQLCLYDTINWNSIVSDKKSFVISDHNREYIQKNTCQQDGYVCDAACSGCWSTGPRSCQICKTYKLDDVCVQDCNNTIINEKYTYVSDQQTRECKYCHPQCKHGCSGPSEFDCNECANYYISINETIIECVDTCPISHYIDVYNGNGKECLPCYKDCYGCTGPKDTIEVGGCTHCSSALVNNDSEYSVIKCIEKDTYNCTNNEFSMLVPQILKNHPLRGKQVCRKCDEQCDGCYGNGVEMNSGCKSCRNYYSNSTGSCVKACSANTEYLKGYTKTCMPCSNECKLWCRGSGIFECNQCRAFQLSFKNAEHIVEKLTKSAHLEELSFHSISLPAKIDYLRELIDINSIEGSNAASISNGRIEILYSMRDYYLKKLNSLEDNSINMTSNDETVFCLGACPSEFPYKTNSNFCSANAYPIRYEMVLIILIAIILSISLVFIVIISLWQRRIKIKQMEREHEEKFFSPDFDKENRMNENDMNKVNMSNLRLVKLNELELGRILGRGAFGTVYEGYYKPYDDQSNYKIKVAIKVLNKCKFSDEKAVTRLSEELINEAKVMASVDHEYCLRLTALCLAEPMMMVTQLMQHGSVVSFYQKYREVCTEKMLLTWSKQIAEGMSYLESRGIVHRDLAARNILVKKFDQIKITDFGLARILDSSEDGIYVLEYSLVPFKWLAIESIKNRLFTHKSDVWSYGICLWEIFTFCSKPYAEYSENDPLTIFNCIVKGTRLAKPQIASLDVYTILLRCWLENPVARPDFKTLALEFAKMCTDPKRYLSIEKANHNIPFKTIDENTQDLLHEIDYFDAPNLSTRSKSESSDKNSDKSLTKEEYIDPETASSGFGDSSSNNEKLDKKSDDNQSNIVKTFKRTNHSNNLKIPNNLSSKISYHRNQSFNENNDGAKNQSNRKRLRKFLGLSQKPKRLDSEISTGTNLTYLSYSCSSVSSPSPRVFKDKNNLNFNYYEEQEELLNNTNMSYGFSSSSPSRSNSNSTHSTHSSEHGQIYDSKRCSSIYKNQRSTTQNTDYLEPIMTNVMQNFEYFGEDDEKKVPAIIIMPDSKASTKVNYYNEGMGKLLLKKHVKTTDI